ncbi:TetR/AcrR family transcriptional regulator C-terminal domain-containing protein [Actinosynnema sp. CA-299493]
MSSAQRPDPPYRRIVAELRARILTGDLRPGDRLLSTRQIARRWGVAVATATRVVATLRDEGLVETKVGSGTVVSARADPAPVDRTTSPRPRQEVGAEQSSTREHVVRTAISIADAEGLDAVSMRRLAAELGVGPMSLYRHVENKDELVAQMADEVFGEQGPPVREPAGWRAGLELIARRQWQLCRRHLWLPRAISFTRPVLVPNMMAQTEWVLRVLDGLGLPVEIRVREALTLHALVITAALPMAAEAEAEQETGVPLDRWWLARRARADELLAGGRFPLLATIPPDVTSDLDELFEYGLARHLDGFAVLVGDRA